MRYFIQLSYNGTPYHGWQIQPNALSVQEVLNKALSTILNQKIETMGAGRTDTGVHAAEMFAHFDCNELNSTSQLVHKLNNYLPKSIAVQEIFLVDDNNHARFDAKKRTYQYHINVKKNVFSENLSWYFNQKLDVDNMNIAAQLLLKYNDFECFSKVHTDVNNFNCTIFEAFWKEQQQQLIFTITADRFLRNMVRAIVGTLIEVGLGKISIQDFTQIIESKNRSNAGVSVPAHGLYLTKIEYDETIFKEISEI